MDEHYVKCLEIENESFRRLHKDNINFQDAQQLRAKNYHKEIELLQDTLKVQRKKLSQEFYDKLALILIHAVDERPFEIETRLRGLMKELYQEKGEKD
jgi:hypothetical protein